MHFDAMFLQFLTFVINAGIHVGCCGCHARFEGTAAQLMLKQGLHLLFTLYTVITYLMICDFISYSNMYFFLYFFKIFYRI